MAVTFVTSNYDFFKKIGVSQNDIDALQKQGLLPSFGIQSVTLSKGEFSKTLKLPSKVTTLLGTNASKTALKVVGKAVHGWLIDVFADMAAEEVYLVKEDLFAKEWKHTYENSSTASTSGSSGNLQVGAGTPSPYTASTKFEVTYDPEAMLPVALRDAVMLYQKVKGTSPGSIYRVVAIGDGIKVACRIKGQNISIRAEGKFTAEVLERLQQVQLTAKDPYYASGHFSIPENSNPGRVLGAVLFTSGLKFDTPIPDYEHLKELFHVQA